MYKLVLGLLVINFTVSCTGESAYSVLLTQDYPDLYEHVFNREADSILTYIDHPKLHMRQQAWRALINTPVSDIDDLITKVQYADTFEGWTALSAQNLNERHLSRLHDLWEKRESLRYGISLVLGRQGNQESLNFLARNFDKIIDADHEYESAMAMGRLMTSYELSPLTMRSILRYAAVIDNAELFQAYFYGLYRARLTVDDEELLSNIWETYEWTDNPEIKQYVLRILLSNDAENTFEKLNIDGVSQMDIQLAIELAQHTALLEWNDKLEQLYTNLLEHENPVVNVTALDQIKTHPGRKADFDDVIVTIVIENEEKEASVRLSGIEASSNPENNIELAESLAGDNEYLLIKKLRIYQKTLKADEYLGLLETLTESENRMEVLFASSALAEWWNGLNDVQKTPSRNNEVRNLVFDLLGKGDRSVSYVIVPFYQTSGLVEQNDFPELNKSLMKYRLPEDVEVYQVFGSLLKEHFEKEGKRLIDSLAQQGNLALNNRLQQQGWEIPDTENTNQTFRMSDWERLGELGYEPVWVLETEKGIIKIAMDVLSAPATISGMDSLSLAGAYNNVAFHRVVPNFVIQGGDVETGDGFGGPDYVVPTEASDKEFKRGMVGIASAGTDTEGSQYFIMHQWAPHLNGNYTIIGEVIEGMEVVDSILVGDKVNEAYWQER